MDEEEEVKDTSNEINEDAEPKLTSPEPSQDINKNDKIETSTVRSEYKSVENFGRLINYFIHSLIRSQLRKQQRKML